MVRMVTKLVITAGKELINWLCVCKGCASTTPGVDNVMLELKSGDAQDQQIPVGSSLNIRCNFNITDGDQISNIRWEIPVQQIDKYVSCSLFS